MKKKDLETKLLEALARVDELEHLFRLEQGRLDEFGIHLSDLMHNNLRPLTGPDLAMALRAFRAEARRAGVDFSWGAFFGEEDNEPAMTQEEFEAAKPKMVEHMQEHLKRVRDKHHGC